MARGGSRGSVAGWRGGGGRGTSQGRAVRNGPERVVNTGALVFADGEELEPLLSQESRGVLSRALGKF